MRLPHGEVLGVFSLSYSSLPEDRKRGPFTCPIAISYNFSSCVKCFFAQPETLPLQYPRASKVLHEAFRVPSRRDTYPFLFLEKSVLIEVYLSEPCRVFLDLGHSFQGS